MGTAIAFNPYHRLGLQAKVGLTMKHIATFAALGVLAFGAFASGCYSPEQRQHVAANRDEDRRADFERCRSAGRTDCDAILNAPVNSTPPSTYPNSSDSVREHEARLAYDRCVHEGGHDCDDLLRR
jgi:hypothetical protein